MYQIEEENVYYASIELEGLFNQNSNEFFKVKKSSKFPRVRRDFSFIIDESITYDDLIKAINKTSRLLKEVKLMDVYYGKPLKKNEKSYSLSITLENDKKTLEDSEINIISKKIIDTISKKFNGVVRS